MALTTRNDLGFRISTRPPEMGLMNGPQCIQAPRNHRMPQNLEPHYPDLFSCSCSTFSWVFYPCFETCWDKSTALYIYIYMLYIIYGYISHQPDIEPYNISQCNISLFIYITRISICPYQLLLSGFWSFLNPSFNQCSIFFESQSKHHLPQHETSS